MYRQSPPPSPNSLAADCLISLIHRAIILSPWPCVQTSGVPDFPFITEMCLALPSPTKAGSATAAPSIPARDSNRIDLHDAEARMRTLIGHVPHT